jgi:hypothetical protein
MAKEKSSHLADVVDAISRIRNAENDWPAGICNPLLREFLRKTLMNLQDELFEIMSQKKERKSSGKKRGSSQGETSRT